MPESSIDTLFEPIEHDLEFQAHYLLGQKAEKLAIAIKAWREARGLSQKELARKLQTQQSRVSKLEDPAYARYNLATLAKVAIVLDIDLSIEFRPRPNCSLIVSPTPYHEPSSGVTTTVDPSNRVTFLKVA